MTLISQHLLYVQIRTPMSKTNKKRNVQRLLHASVCTHHDVLVSTFIQMRFKFAINYVGFGLVIAGANSFKRRKLMTCI